MKNGFLLNAVAAIAVSLCANAAALGDVYHFYFDIDASQMVPPTNSPVTGYAHYTYDDSARRLDIECFLEGIDRSDLTAIHSHIGAAGSPGHGQNIFDLGHPSQWDPLNGGWFWEGFIVNFPTEFEDELLNDLTYLAVHTRQHPNGAARGQQLVRPRLTHTALFRGQAVTIQVDRADRNDEVVFLYSTSGVGFGPSIPQFGGLRLDILNPITVLGSRRADARGRATFSTQIPGGAPLIQIALQAVIRRGNGGAESIQSNTSSTAILP